MQVLSIDRLIKLFRCMFVLVTIIFTVYIFIHSDSLRRHGHELPTGPHFSLNDPKYAIVPNLWFIAMMVYSLVSGSGCPEVLMFWPQMALVRIVIPSRHPDPLSMTQSLMVFGITHIIISITLVILLCLKPKIY